MSLLLGLAASPALAADQYLVRVPANVNLSAPPPPSAPLAVSLGATPLHQAIVGESYTFDFTSLLSISGGAGSGYNLGEVAWSLDSGTLPAGLTLNTNGTIGGTPTEAKTSDFTLRATYKTASGVQAYQLVSAQIVVTLQSATLPAAMVDTDYAPYDFKSRLAVTGDPAYAVENVSFSATGLPQGMTLSSVGVLSGKPTTKNAAGASFEVKASYKGKDGQQSYTIVVNGVELQVTQISAGGYHTCAITPSGGVMCWGNGSSGQLGNGGTTNSTTPVNVTGLGSGVTQISAGQNHTCAVTTAGAAMCWGRGNSGQLGNSSASDSATPVSVTGLGSGVTQITAGGYHACAVHDGAAKCWGSGANGQLGNGSTANSPRPVSVIGLDSGVMHISAGQSHTCAVTTAGAAMCWGYGGSGRLGNGGTLDRATPVSVTGLSADVTQITAGYLHTCALHDGAAKCWGDGANGRLGKGSTSYSATPVSVTGLGSGVTQITAGGYHACAVHDGAAKCWGSGANGQLGNGSTANSPRPVSVIGLDSGVMHISAGQSHTCAVTTAGAAMCWGYGGSGRLGNGGTLDRATPVSVTGLSADVTQITAGYLHTCALHDGAAKCWGDGANGRLGKGSTSYSATPVNVIGLGSSVTQIAAGGLHTCAVHAGAAKCWGWGAYGQLGNGSKTESTTPVSVTGLDSGVKQIAAGLSHTCAVHNGAAKCWGNSGNGRLGNGGTTSTNTPVDVQF